MVPVMHHGFWAVLILGRDAKPSGILVLGVFFELQNHHGVWSPICFEQSEHYLLIGQWSRHELEQSR